MDLKIFSERLTETRQAAKLNYKELSKKSGVTSTAISYYEKGTKAPTLESAAKIAVALGVSLDWLCGIEKKVNTGGSETATILLNILNLMDKFDITTNTDSNFASYLNAEIPSNIKLFIAEYSSIQRMEQMTKLMTPEMKNDLINGLIKKYSDKILITDSGKVTDINEMEPIANELSKLLTDVDDLPF